MHRSLQIKSNDDYKWWFRFCRSQNETNSETRHFSIAVSLLLSLLSVNKCSVAKSNNQNWLLFKLFGWTICNIFPFRLSFYAPYFFWIIIITIFCRVLNTFSPSDFWLPWRLTLDTFDTQMQWIISFYWS